MYADSRVAFDNAYRNNGKSIAKWQKKKNWEDSGLDKQA